MDNFTIGLIFVDIAMALGLYNLGGIPAAAGALAGAGMYFILR